MVFFESKSARSLLLTLAVALVAIIGAEVAFRHSDLHDRLAASSRYRALPLAFEAHAVDPDVVFLGDSRVIHGVVPEIVEDLAEREAGVDIAAYNLGVPGAPPLTHFAWTGYLLEREQKPRLVVLYWSEYMFGSEIEPRMSREALPSVYQAEDAVLLPQYGVPVEDVFRAVTSDLFRLVRFRRPLLGWLLDGEEIGGPETIAHLGYERAARVSAARQARRARKRARGYRRELSPPATLNEEQFALFEATIRRLQDAGVEVLVMTTPASRPLWENYSDKTIYPQIRRRVEEKLDELGVEMIDYRDGEPVEDTYFADGDHLNPEGARRYTTYITRHHILPRLSEDYD